MHLLIKWSNLSHYIENTWLALTQSRAQDISTEQGQVAI